MKIDEQILDLSCELANYTGKETENYVNKNIKPIEDTLYIKTNLKEIEKSVDEIKFPIDDTKFKLLLILTSAAREVVDKMK